MKPTALPQSATFVRGAEQPWQTVGTGISRQVLTYDAELMVVKVAFETGGVGEPHQHRHTQATYIESGEFEVTIAGKTQRLRTGDAFHVPSHELHGVVCVAAGVLVDVFAPMREDFV